MARSLADRLPYFRLRLRSTAYKRSKEFAVTEDFGPATMSRQLGILLICQVFWLHAALLQRVPQGRISYLRFLQPLAGACCQHAWNQPGWQFSTAEKH